MTSRSRGRLSLSRNDSEECALWDQLRLDAKRIDSLVCQSNRKWERMCDLQCDINSSFERGVSPSSSLEDELGDLARENIKLIEDIVSATDNESDDSSLSFIRSLELFGALRASTESKSSSPHAVTRAAIGSAGSGGEGESSKFINSNLNNGKSRRLSKRKERERTTGWTDSTSNRLDDRETSTSTFAPTSSNRFMSPRLDAKTASRVIPRQNVRGLSNRSSPVITGRDSTLKGEDSSFDGPYDTPRQNTNRPTLAVGAQVFFRTSSPKTVKSKQERDPVDGEGILCSITSIYGDAKQRRYEIQDSDPDPPSPLQAYRTTSANLLPIPVSNHGLPHLPHGTRVLALYPGTTTFYKAEVVSQINLPATHLQLQFEEDEDDRIETVERRFILNYTK